MIEKTAIMTKVIVERPSSSAAGKYTVCESAQHSSLVSIDTIECVSKRAAGLTEGRLTDNENQQASIRVKIRPSVFIIETNKEYTEEEISTDALAKLIQKRIKVFKENIISTPTAKRRKMEEEYHLMAKEHVVGLETAAELLPVVINVTDWTLCNEEEIRLDLNGNQGMEELVNAFHLNSEEWELDRVTAMILNNATGVFYARHNMLDIIVTKSQVTLQTLLHPVIFRLKNVKVWINTPLQLAIPSSSSTTRKVLYQHPSLTKVDDLKNMAVKSKSVSALLIPGVTNFNPSELELLNKDGKHLHYFTAQCYFSKSNLSLSDFLKKQHVKYDNDEEETSSLTTIETKDEKETQNKEETSTTTTKTKEEEERDETERKKRAKEEEERDETERKKRADTVLAAFGTDLDEISTAVSKDYADWYETQKSKYDGNAVLKTHIKKKAQKEAEPISFKRPVSCFFGPNFDSIIHCIEEENCGLQMHLFPCLDDRSKKRTFVVSSDNVMKEIHNSGRFLNVTDRVVGFVPDVDVETLKNILKSPYSHSVVASLLYYNNADIGNFLKGLTTNTRLPSLADAIVELVTSSVIMAKDDSLVRAVGEIAEAVSSLYRLRDDSECAAILFPDEQLMAERHSGNRPYYWHDPIRCVVGIYKAVMDNLMTNLRRGEPVFRDDSSWTFMHVSVLEDVLTPFFDSVLKTGAWAIDEVRDFLRWILEDVLLKYTATVDQHTALNMTQPVLDIMARLCVHWTIMQSGAENRGLCIAFSEEPPFIIEPGLSLKNYILSTIPEVLLSGENVVDRIRAVFKPVTTSGETISTTAQQQIRVVPIKLPSGKFFKSGKDLTVLIVEPNDDEGDAQIKKTTVERKRGQYVIDYSAPRILSEPQVGSSSNVGFRHLKTSGVLTAEYSIGKTNAKEDNGDNDDTSFAVDGVVTGVSIDGKMEHVNLFLPGTKAPPEYVSMNVTEHGKYLIKDKGLEAVFFEPLLSSLVLDTAANEKRVYFDSAKLYKECLAPLRTGKIVIYPNKNTLYESVAGPGFDWLWRVLQKNYGLSANADKFYPKPYESVKKNKQVSLSGSTVVEPLLRSIIKQLSSGGGLIKKKAITGASAGSSNNNNNNNSTPVATPSAFSPSFVEIDTFLKQQFKNVLSTLLTRMTMVVSISEVKIIKSVCESVANIILDSFYISLEPEQGVISILDRISGEQNGVFLDAEGFGFSITRLTGANILAGRQQQQQGTGGTTSTLERLLSHLHSLGTEEQQQKQQRSREQQTDKQNIAKKKHSEQMKIIRDSSMFTTRLIKLIRDDDKSKRINNMVSEAVKSQQRTPPYMISAMTKPAKPVFGSSGLPATEKPQSVNFSSAQYIYVPINPKHILTDMQWLECMSVIEAATRDFAKAVRDFEEAAGKKMAELKKLLEDWNKIVDDQDTSVLSLIKLEWVDKEATRIAELRDVFERSRVALAVQGKVVNIKKYGIIAISRSLADIDFYVKLPNSWPSGNWGELVHSAVSLTSIPLEVNISKGIMAASQAATVYDSSIALFSTEKILHNVE
uniref:Wsv289-like protein n=1 Tax=Sesarmops intermedium nimavirus TaxID=2133796 RepID=A0A401IPN8_9VIRU|nr:MAG: wsv289-like protein [Sesarmops intermedium nimavirus]GBG35572.1 wsv289-like protein [Sesarmops intermedium nimavirus]